MATKTITPEEFVDALPSWSVLDVVNAVKLMEEKLGIKAAAPVAVAAAPSAAAEAAPVEEQTEFTVVLTAVGDAKINVIKAVREITGSASRRPRTWWTPPPSRSARRCPARRPTRSRPSCRRRAPPPRSASLHHWKGRRRRTAHRGHRPPAPPPGPGGCARGSAPVRARPRRRAATNGFTTRACGYTGRLGILGRRNEHPLARARLTDRGRRRLCYATRLCPSSPASARSRLSGEL